MKHSIVISALALLAVAGCKYEGSAVQKQYTSDRQECRAYAEHTVGGFSGNQEHQLHLVTQFANCMHKRGWAVNKPPEE